MLSKIVLSLLFSTTAMAADTAEVAALKATNLDLSKAFVVVAVIEEDATTDSADFNKVVEDVKANCKVDKADVLKTGTPVVVSIAKIAGKNCSLEYKFTVTESQTEDIFDTKLTVGAALQTALKMKLTSYTQNYKARAVDDTNSAGTMTFATESTDKTKINGTLNWKMNFADQAAVVDESVFDYNVSAAGAAAKKVQILVKEVLNAEGEPVADKSSYKIDGKDVTAEEANDAALK